MKLFIGGLAIGVLGMYAANARTQADHAGTYTRCDYTLIVDKARPNLGENGAIDYHGDRRWETVLANGWRLKATTGAINNYIFEKCR